MLTLYITMRLSKNAEFRHLVITDTVYFKYFAHNLQIRHFRHVCNFWPQNIIYFRYMHVYMLVYIHNCLSQVFISCNYKTETYMNCSDGRHLLTFILQKYCINKRITVFQILLPHTIPVSKVRLPLYTSIII